MFLVRKMTDLTSLLLCCHQATTILTTVLVFQILRRLLLLLIIKQLKNGKMSLLLTLAILITFCTSLMVLMAVPLFPVAPLWWVWTFVGLAYILFMYLTLLILTSAEQRCLTLQVVATSGSLLF